MVSVFGSKPAGLSAFKDSGFGGDDFSLKDHIGKALIVTVQGVEEVKTQFGLKPAVKADVAVLDGKTAETFSDVLIFQSVPVKQLTPSTGQQIVAVVGTYETKQGSQAVKLVEPPAEAVAAAEAYLAAA